MRSTALKLFGSIALLGATTLPVSAAPVTLHYTADNDVVGWWIYSTNGPNETLVASNTSGSKGTEWWETATTPLDLDPGSYNVYFEARNFADLLQSGDTTPTTDNPAAFIASIDGVTGDGAETSANWAFFDTTGLVSGENVWALDPVNFIPSFGSVFTEGANGTSPWGVRPFISSTAQFIWGNSVNQQLPGQAQRGIFGASFVVAPVPVPAALWLFGSAILSMLRIGRRKA